MSGIKWQRAKAELSKAWATFGCSSDTWPERMAPRQLAVLQSLDDADPWKRAIVTAVIDGSLPHAIRQFERPNYLLRLDGGPLPPPEMQDLPAIAADDFARWLHSQSETPSVHIQAWIDATATLSDAPAPANDSRTAGRLQAAPERASDEPQDGQPAKRWTPERLAELKAYREKHSTKAAASHYNISTARIRELLPSEKPQPKGYSAFNQRVR